VAGRNPVPGGLTSFFAWGGARVVGRRGVGGAGRGRGSGGMGRARVGGRGWSGGTGLPTAVPRRGLVRYPAAREDVDDPEPRYAA